MDTHSLWLVEFSVPAHVKDSFMDALEEHADSMTCFEDGCEERWKLQIYRIEEPDETLQHLIEQLANDNTLDIPQVNITFVPPADWVSESQKNFEAVEAGIFFVYPSWRREEVPPHATAIEIDPQRAFGTGRHETTRGCLLALQEITISPQRILDMGCGSGLLAIGAAKLWPKAEIWAADNDPVCVETTLTNAQINHVGHIQAALSDGYNSHTVQTHAPYDLILANILAQPLIDLAPQATAALANGGTLILSGLLNTQAEAVTQAHFTHGLKLEKQASYGDWTVLVLRKD